MKKETSNPFDYSEAFSRNLGWLTESEQHRLRKSRIAIAGMGGVGGAHLLTLTRLGVGAFHIADLDVYELANFNRQVGASTKSLGKPKVATMAELAADINPEVEIEPFPNGIDESNIDRFLKGVDLFVDGIDFFAMPTRKLAFRRCATLGIPALTAAPLGMGTTYLYFDPNHMSFDDYFGHDDDPDRELVNFFVGITPRELHRGYLVNPSSIDLKGHRGPSNPMAIQLCSAVVGTEALKILLARGPRKPAPWCHQFDIYEGRWVSRRVVGGSRNPLQALKRRVAYRAFLKRESGSAAESFEASNDLEKILDLARWTPSGDNNQPWRFEIKGNSSVVVHVTDQRDHDVYDNAGLATLLSTGMLVETIRIAATKYGKSIRWRYEHAGESLHRLHVETRSDGAVKEDDLASCIRTRSVDRRPYRPVSLTESQKEQLTLALEPVVEIRWFESIRDRLRFVKLNRTTTDLRFRIPEAARVHEEILDLDHTFSTYGVSWQALGLDPVMARFLRWAMRDPKRMEKITGVLGTGGPSIQLDAIPGLLCGAHFIMALRSPSSDRQHDAVVAGQHVQRFWLKATELGLAIQPGYAPLSFAYYAEHGVDFTEMEKMKSKATVILNQMRSLWPERTTDTLLFLGRIGVPPALPPRGRSVRKPLSELLLRPEHTSVAGGPDRLAEGPSA